MDTINQLLVTVSPVIAGSGNFLETAAGLALIRLLSMVGLILVIIAGVKAGGQVLSGKIAPAIKIVGGALVAVAFLFNPNLFIALVEWFGNMIEMLLDSASDVTDGDSGGTGTNPADGPGI